MKYRIGELTQYLTLRTLVLMRHSFFERIRRASASVAWSGMMYSTMLIVVFFMFIHRASWAETIITITTFTITAILAITIGGIITAYIGYIGALFVNTSNSCLQFHQAVLDPWWGLPLQARIMTSIFVIVTAAGGVIGLYTTSTYIALLMYFAIFFTITCLFILSYQYYYDGTLTCHSIRNNDNNPYLTIDTDNGQKTIKIVYNADLLNNYEPSDFVYHSAGNWLSINNPNNSNKIEYAIGYEVNPDLIS